MCLFGRKLRCVRLVDLRYCAAFGGFYHDFDVCNVNNFDSDHGVPVIVHLRCLCNFSLLRYKEDDPSAAGSFR